MIGYAFQFGTQAAATTVETLVDMGATQAHAMVSLLGIPLRIPFHAMHAAMEFARDMPSHEAMPRATAYTSCPEAEALAAYADGAVDGFERAELEAHLILCRSCRGTIADVVLMAPLGPPVSLGFHA